MSLNWSIDKVAGFKTLCWLPCPTDDEPDAARLNPITDRLIWGTMAVGIGEITAATWEEFHCRMAIWDRFHGYPEISRVDVRAHIGLRTNVSKETRAKWITRHMDAWISEARYRENRT